MALKPSWSWVAPRLASLYQRGLLVPFIGAGLSRPTCTAWRELVLRLEAQAETGAGAGEDAEALVRRANRAVVALRNRGGDALVSAVRQAVTASPNAEPPPATRQLAEVWWPLVITTNYDDLYATAVERRWRTRPLVLGRSSLHCFQVGRALREAVPPMVWAIQGFLDAPCERRFDPSRRLVPELVVGHEEYRRVTHRELHFRRVFAEVYRSRSLLFVGSGLQERYFLDLFSEIRETFGPNGQLHYAFAPAGTLDVDFLLREYQIAVVEYRTNGDDHGELETHLAELVRAIDAVPAQTRWELRVPGARGPTSFAVESTPLPFEAFEALPGGHCIAVSADRLDGRIVLGTQIREEVAGLGLNPEIPAVDEVVRYGDEPLYAVIAREPDGERSLASVYWGTREILGRALEDGFTTVRAQLLASGPGLGAGGSPPYWPMHALCEMAAAFGDFARVKAGDRELRMVVHVVDQGVLSELRRGRLSLEEHLACIDLRLWVSIELPGQSPVYHVVHVPAEEFAGAERPAREESVTLGELADSFSVPRSWTVDVWPSPGSRWERDRVQNHAGEPVIYAAVQGSTVRFMAPDATA
jgi:hypothetical protein